MRPVYYLNLFVLTFSLFFNRLVCHPGFYQTLKETEIILLKEIIFTEVSAVALAFVEARPLTTAAVKLLHAFVYLDDRPIFFFFSPAVFS